MFTNDPKLNPRLPLPTSFDGVKLSYVEWSEELLTYLSVTDYQEFIPILQAVTGHKDVITKKALVKGVLSEIIKKTKKKNLELEAITSGAQAEDAQDATLARVKGEIKALEDQKNLKRINTHESRQLSQVCSASLNIRRPQHHDSSHHENVKLALRCFTGLEIWRQMAVTYAGSAQIRVVTLLKQIMTPTEWNPDKSPNVLHMYHHWLELISKYESLISEKIAPNIKITLALQMFVDLLPMLFPSASTKSQHGMRSSTTAFPQTQRRSISSTSAARSQRRIQ